MSSLVPWPKEPARSSSSPPLKEKPSGNSFDAQRVRRDWVDSPGKVSLRRTGTRHKLGLVRPRAAKQALIVPHEREAPVPHLFTGEALGEQLMNRENQCLPKAANP